MSFQHFTFKLHLSSPVDLDPFIGVFNQWIQRRVTPELLIDVADYRHVPAGPGLIIIGHEANYSLDHLGNRWGLLYNRKAELDGTNLSRLEQAAHATLVAAQRLEKENGLVFNGGDVQVTINDRLLAPNNTSTFAALLPDLQAFFTRLYAGAPFAMQVAHADPRERFTVNVTATTPFSVDALLQNVAETRRGASLQTEGAR